MPVRECEVQRVSVVMDQASHLIRVSRLTSWEVIRFGD